jgi:uncharacterized protein YjeT (DUF2065 family)
MAFAIGVCLLEAVEGMLLMLLPLLFKNLDVLMRFTYV